MKILGIETSCDETAAAVVEDGVRILSNVVVSQIDIFAEYGGVIPEVAARSHLEVILSVINKALSDASCTWDEIDAIAVTHAPGLLGSLLIGTLTARTLAILHNKPLYAVHHLKSHVYANWLNPENSRSEAKISSFVRRLESEKSHTLVRRENRPSGEPLGDVRNIDFSDSNQIAILTKEDILATPSFPLLALVVSGGHTQILYMPGHNQFEIIGTTVDDAVGECFDKVAKILGLPYPGGPSISSAAEEGAVYFSDTLKGARPSLRSSKHTAPSSGNSNKYKFPHPRVAGLDFSFSGLKTAVLRAVQKEVGVPISCPSHKLAGLLTPEQVADFAASFQKTAVNILVEKMEMAVRKYPEVKSIVVAGGVSANGELKSSMASFVRRLESEKSHTLVRRENRPSGEPLRDVRNIDFSDSNQITILTKEAIELYFPSPALSGDNGAMVGAAAYYEIQSGVKPVDPYAMNIYPRVSIEN